MLYEKFKEYEDTILEISRQWDYERMLWWYEQLEKLREDEYCRNGYEINIYFDDKDPYRIHGDEAVTILSEVYGNNFIYYPFSNMYGWKDGCWVRKDIYEKYYESIIVPLEQVRPKRLYYCSEI